MPVKRAGGNVTGKLRVSLSWFNHDDLDLHVVMAHGQRQRECRGAIRVSQFCGKKTRSPTVSVCEMGCGLRGRLTPSVTLDP